MEFVSALRIRIYLDVTGADGRRGDRDIEREESEEPGGARRY